MENLLLLRKIRNLCIDIEMEIDPDDFDDELKSILKKCEEIELSIDKYIDSMEMQR